MPGKRVVAAKLQSLWVLCNSVIKIQHFVERASAEVLHLCMTSLQKSHAFGDKVVLAAPAEDLPPGRGGDGGFIWWVHPCDCSDLLLWIQHLGGGLELP